MLAINQSTYLFPWAINAPRMSILVTDPLFLDNKQTSAFTQSRYTARA